MKIKTNDLLKKLELVKDLNDENDFSGLAKSIYFVNNKIISTNGRMFCEVGFESELSDFSIVQKEFFLAIQKIKCPDIELFIDNDKLIILAKKIKIEFLVNKNIDDIKNLLFDEEYIRLPNDFIEALKLSQFCIDKNSTDGKGYITISDNTIYTTDGMRIFIYKFSDNIENMMIPADCLFMLLKHKVDFYAENEKFFFFNSENINIGILKNDVEELDYAKYKEIIEADPDLKIKLPVEIKDNLNLSEIFTDQKNLFQKEIQFEIKNHKIICKSQNEVGKIETEIDIESDIEISFFIHPLFLLEILDNCDEMGIFGDIVLFTNDKFIHFFRIKL